MQGFFDSAIQNATAPDGFLSAVRDMFDTVAGKSAAERALKAWGIPWVMKNGVMTVEGDLDISSRKIRWLPDLSRVVVEGDFCCPHNRLVSLRGAPKTVKGSFYCHNNQLMSLEDGPRSVGGDYLCQNNALTLLKGAPQTVTGHFCCNNNMLTSLEGGPVSVGKDFYCEDNPVPLSLRHAPTVFKHLKCSEGTFSSWEALPEHLRGPLAEKPQVTPPQAVEDWAYGATVLDAPMSVRKPLKLTR